MVLVTRSLVSGGLECILLGAFCHLPRQACSLPSPCRLCGRETLCTAACCEHWKDGRSRGLQSPWGTPWQAAGVMRRLIICLLGCFSVRRKPKQKMGRRRISKHTRWRCSKPHDIGSGSYKVLGHSSSLSLGTQGLWGQGAGQGETPVPGSHQIISPALLAGKLQGIFHPLGGII